MKLVKKDLRRVIILFDGSNFYYNTAKRKIKVDFRNLVSELSHDMDLVGAYYYIAPLDIKSNEKTYWSHQRFLTKLSEIFKFNVVLCTLKKIRSEDGSYAYYIKGDDVKFSNKLLLGAVKDEYDVAIIVTGDEDFVDSVAIS